MKLWSSQNGDVNIPGLSPNAINGMNFIGAEVYNTDAQTATIVLTAADLSGGEIETVLGLTGAISTAQNAQLPTVAALVAAIPNGSVGQTYKLRIMNVGGTSSGVFTITTNTGWTLTGTMTIAVGAYRDFLVTLTALNAAVLQNIGGGTV